PAPLGSGRSAPGGRRRPTSAVGARSTLSLPRWSGGRAPATSWRPGGRARTQGAPADWTLPGKPSRPSVLKPTRRSKKADHRWLGARSPLRPEAHLEAHGREADRALSVPDPDQRRAIVGEIERVVLVVALADRAVPESWNSDQELGRTQGSAEVGDSEERGPRIPDDDAAVQTLGKERDPLADFVQRDIRGRVAGSREHRQQQGESGEDQNAF